MTLVASRLVARVPGGVQMRWRSLTHALEHSSRLSTFLVACDQFGGCTAACKPGDHEAAGDAGDPFAIHFCQRLFRDLVAHVRSTKTQIAVVTNIQLHRYARELADLGICRVVYDMHNAEYPLCREIQAVAPAEWRKAFYSETACSGVREAEGSAIAAATAVWTCSETDSQRVQASYGDNLAPKLRVVPNAVAASATTDPRPPTHVFFTGRFDYYPNVAALRILVGQIAPLLAESVPDLPVVLAGAGLPAGDPNSPSGNVRFVPNPRDIDPLISSGVMTVPLALGGGTRFKVLQALALGAPVISTQKGVEGLGMTDRTHYLRAETATDFVEAIRRLTRDQDLQRSLVTHGSQLLGERYSTAVLAETVRHRLEDLT